MREIGKADDKLFTYAQRFLDDEIDLRHILHALIEDYIIKRLIGIFHQARFNITVEYAEALLDALVRSLIIELYPLHAGAFYAGLKIEKLAASTAQIEHSRAGFDGLEDNLVVKAKRIRFHHSSTPRSR